MSGPMQPGNMSYVQSNGSAPNLVCFPHLDVRDPTVTDILYQIGRPWVNTVGNTVWVLTSQTSIGGVIQSVWTETGSSAGAIFSVLGTANQITATTSAGTVTLSIPSTFIAPGSIASTTTLTGGTGITATTGNITATTGNLVLSAAGSKLTIHATTAASDSVGTTGAMITGAVTITSSAITAASKIIYSRRTLGTAMGNVSITAQAPGSATLTSDAATETSTFDYIIIN